MSTRIRVKFIGNYRADLWKRQFPGGEHVWGQCEYLFDVNATDYDWLVVYNDLPPSRLEELLCCAQQQTILVTMEPSSIKIYGRAFSAQFGAVLTSQPESALPHPNRIFSQSGLQWFYGVGQNRLLSHDEMMSAPPLTKNKVMSTVCSSKQQKHTLHHKRYNFTQALKQKLPYLDIYGHGVKPLDDKAEALDDYKYHLTIENYIGPHHWTEKLSDAFLGATLPFYSGCPNATDYFPEESFIPIDIDDVAGTTEIIQRAINGNEYEKRLPHILEARRRVMNEYNLFAVLAGEIESRHVNGGSVDGGETICSRRTLRRAKPLVAFQDFFDKCRSRLMSFSNK